MIAVLAASGTALLGESPRWMRLGAQRPALHFTDLLSATVHRLHGGATPTVLEFPGETVSALVPLPEGGAAVALHRSVAVLDSSAQLLRTIDLPALPPGLRLSDGSAGPSGDLWLGAVPIDGSTAPGMLMRLSAGDVIVERRDIGFSNGLGFTADGRALMHIDSATNSLWLVRHNPVTGRLGAARELFRLPAGRGVLDGLCIDQFDRAWIAVFGGAEVLCIDHFGAVVERVTVASRRVTSCTFGWNSTLYITTARIGASDDELAEYPLSGSVFACEVGCLGGPVWEGARL